MRSKLALSVILFGWIVFFTYILSEFRIYGNDLLRHLFSLDVSPTAMLLRIFILTAPIGAHIIGYLIADRKKLFKKTQTSEQQLARAANEWRTTFDSMSYGIILTDRDFNVIRVNKFFADFVGFSVKEPVNKKCYELIHKTNTPIHDCPVVKYAGIRGTQEIEYYDEQFKKHINMRVTPIFKDDVPYAYMHSLTDITDRKKQEIKLIQSKDAFFNMLKDIDLTHKELIEVHKDLIIAFANAIDAKSSWTRGHSVNVSDYAVKIAGEMGIKGREVEDLRTAALLHDIGKIGTYDVILDKPGELTKEEFELIRQHPVKGEEILEPIKGLKNIIPMIRSHHERIDGKGYPDGLKGDEIPILAKIVCAADSFDAMTSDRPYRSSRGREYAISELKKCAGTQFDTQVVEAFLKVLEK